MEGMKPTLSAFGWFSSRMKPLPLFWSVKPQPLGMAPVPKPKDGIKLRDERGVFWD